MKQRNKAAEKTTRAASTSSKVKEKLGQIDIAALMKDAPSQSFYTSMKPMLATLVDKPFAADGWIYEVKWDGYRAVAFMNKGEVTLKSRNDKGFEKKFYPVYQALKNWKINAVVDGEIVVLDADGKANFGALQNWRSEADGEIYFYLFDLMWLNGKDLTKLPLYQRKAILAAQLPGEGIIRLSSNYTGSGIEFFEAAKKMGLEGIIAKKRKASTAVTQGLRTGLK